MGLRNSKHSPKSYDIAPVVSDTDFSFKRHSRSVPEIVLPAVNEDQEVEVTNREAIAKENRVKNVTHITQDGEEIKNNGDISEPKIEQSLDNKETPLIDPRIPKWVNEENFKPVLKKSFPTFKDIRKFHPFPALAPGENYATLILRVKITFRHENNSTQDVSYMLKVAHDTEQMKDMLQKGNFFITENAVYNDVIPEMEDMYRQAGATVEIAPKAYQLAEDAPSLYYILLEDLGVRGFKNANRLECLDMDHTLAVLKKMAQFHAASACRVATKGPYAEQFSPPLDNEMVRVFIGQMFGAFKKPFLNNLDKYENGDKYYKKMENFFDSIVEVFINSRTNNPKHFNVLNHADAWSNNILFNYNKEGKVNEVVFIDFQNTNFGCAASDLYYFIISSVRVDIKISKFDYFIRFYHENLVENLKLLKYPGEIPNLRKLHIQLLDYGCWATLTAFLTMGIVLLDPTDSAKFENFMAENEEGMEFKNKMFSNPRYIEYINEVLPWLYNRGFMDIKVIDNDISAIDKSAIDENKYAAPESMKCVYPEWVNELYFNDIISGEFENVQRISKFSVCPATSPGDNYSSVMLKVDIDIELKDNSSHTASYILKIPPNGSEAQAVIEFLGSFVKEITAYNEILPQFEEAYKQQAGMDIVFGAKSYKPQIVNEKDTLILENLKIKGFKNSDRLRGLDMEHMKAVLKKLAQLHAASAYVYETKGKFPAVYENSIYTEEYRKQKSEQFTEFYNMYYNCIKDFEGSEEYIGELKHFLDNMFDCMMEAHKIDRSKFNVLNHGDCWTNNIMFQHDEKGNILNTYFVDFQLMKYGSPAYDLYYLIFTSSRFDLKLEHFDYFIRYYHENLTSNLKLLQYTKHIPSLRELQMELLDQGSWALYAVITPMAVILLDPTDNASLDLLIRTDESGTAFKKKIFSQERYRHHAEALYPWLSRRGLLTIKTI